MTKRNTLLNADYSKAVPFLLQPVGKDYLWGGSRLNDEYAKNIDLQPLAETWECSTHPDGISIVASGKFCGSLLTDVLKRHPEYLGRRHEGYSDKPGELPILVKLIDAKSDLSIQVHPDDTYAKQYENGQSGKTEMWYVLDADRETKLVYGLNRDADKETLRESILHGSIEKDLQKIRIRKGDVYYVEAGTIHAIGAGALIAEIQENSNLTYRLYDYKRLDKNGKMRELHIEQALQAANLKGSEKPAQPMRLLRYHQGHASELLCRCKYFEVHRMMINTERYRRLAEYQADSLSFHVLLCISGCGAMLTADGNSILFFKGDCIFFPADSAKVKFHGKAQFLEIRG